ncbi:MAG: flagellar hook-length control protein FliK [Nocardioides sp.]
MSIAPFQPASAAPPSPQKTEGKSAAAGKDDRHDDAGTDSGLGFLAELAAASVAITPIIPQAPVPTLLTGGTGDALAGGTKGAATTALMAELAANAADGMTATGLPAALAAATGLPGTTTPAPAGAAQVLATGAVAAAAAALTQAAQPIPATAATPAKPGATAAKTASTTVAAPTAQAADAPAADAPPAADATDLTALPATGDPTATDTAPVPATPAPAATDAALATIAASAATDSLAAAAVSAPTPIANDQPPAQTTAVLRQVFPEITKAAATGPGTHRIAITLHPDDLGEVRVTVVVRGDSVRVDVATDPLHGVARTALEHGAPELRRLLEATGADAKVTFREFGTPGNGSTTGSAADGGRSQGFAQAQAQLQAQAEARSNGQGGNTSYASGRPDGTEPSDPTTPAGAPEDTSAPTARRATSGVDQLI